MAFRREALELINGFDPQFRTAGDDVDICWRLQQAGKWITFAPGAVVWHHRRQGPKAYLKQQAGYGEAEALLLFKHPERFNRRGESKWRGVMYGMSLSGIRLGRSLIYKGTFGSGLFQCLYQPASAHWAMVPTRWNGTPRQLRLALQHCMAYFVDRCSRYVRIVVSRGCVECMAGTNCEATRWAFFAAPCRSAFVCSTAGPLLLPISDPSRYFQSAASAPWLTDKSSGKFSFSGQQKCVLE